MKNMVAPSMIVLSWFHILNSQAGPTPYASHENVSWLPSLWDVDLEDSNKLFVALTHSKPFLVVPRGHQWPHEMY